MAKFKSVRGRPASKKNRITNYIQRNLKNNVDKECFELKNSFEDLVLNSPQNKRRKVSNSDSPSSDKVLHSSPKRCPKSYSVNFNKTPKQKIASPKKVKKVSSRNLFLVDDQIVPACKRKYRNENDNSEHLFSDLENSMCKIVDIDPSLPRNSAMKTFPGMPKVRSSPRKFKRPRIELFPSVDSDLINEVKFSELDCLKNVEKGLNEPKMNSSNTSICAETPHSSLKSDINSDSINFLEEVATRLYNQFDNPMYRLSINHIPKCCINQAACNPSEHQECSWESIYNTESLTALLNVHSFADTALDLIKSHLSTSQFLSWKILRVMIYHTMNNCAMEVFKRAINIALDQLTIHPPCAPNMRDFYLNLLDHDDLDDLRFDVHKQVEKGLLKFLMEVFSRFFKCCDDRRPKRIIRSNKKYMDGYDGSYSDMDEEKSPDKFATPHKKRGRKKIVKNSGNIDSVNDNPNFNLYAECEGVLPSKCEKMNITLSSALSLIEKRNEISISPEDMVERHFILLNYVLKILEIDFLVWSMKNSKNTCEQLISAIHGPLVADLMWDRNVGFSCFSTRVKDIFHFYSVSNSTQRKYFERLIVLLAEVMRIFDSKELISNIESENRLLKYPYFSGKCNDFSDELFFHFQKNSSVPLKTKQPNFIEEIERLKSLKPSWLKLFIANRLLNQALGAKLQGNILSIIQVLKSYTHDSSYSSSSPVAQPPKQSIENPIKKLRTRTNINHTNFKGETQLHTFCAKKKADQVKKLLLFTNINLMAQDNNGWTAFHEAVFAGSLECCELLLGAVSSFDKKQDLLTCKSFNGTTPLLGAVMKNHLEVADFILKAGGPSLLLHVNCDLESVHDLCRSLEMEHLLKKHAETPARSFLYIAPQIWEILLILASAYCETYETTVCLKYKHLELSPSDFSNYSAFRNHEGKPVIQINASHYVKDLLLLNELRTLIKDLKIHNENTKELLLLDLIFS